MIGQLVAERYQILKALSSGYVANTYLAQDLHHPERARCVVKHLKQLHPDPGLAAISQQLFKREVESLARLGVHNQIPELLDHFEYSGEHFLVQEFVEGHSLAEELTPGTWWETPQVIQFLADMLDLLSFVHGQGIIHRDIKPANIMYRHRDHRLVLVDFGAACLSPPKSVDFAPDADQDVVVGTPGYMAPEQAAGNPQPCSDLYALGMIAVQAVTGKFPKKLQENVMQPCGWQTYANVSSEMEILLSKLVHQQYQQRFQSADEVSEAIQSCQDVAVKNISGREAAVRERPAFVRYYAYIDRTPTSNSVPTEIIPGDDLADVPASSFLPRALQPFRTRVIIPALKRWVTQLPIPAAVTVTVILLSTLEARPNHGLLKFLLKSMT